jgi:hypothetical protein
MSDRTQTKHLLARLRRHYIKPGQTPAGGVFLEECGLNGNQGTSSRCDAVYVGFTSSSGRLLVGHEVKVSRADWRRELSKPGKADTWADQCHSWYVVAPSVDVVPPDELPRGWGLMVPPRRATSRMDIKVPAAVHMDRMPSWDITRSVLARLDTLQAHEIAAIRRAATDDARRELDEHRAQAALAGLTHHQRERLARLAELEEFLGVELTSIAFRDQCTPAQAADLLRAVQARDRVGYLATDMRGLEACRRTLTGALAEIAAYERAVAGLHPTSNNLHGPKAS